MVVAFLRRNRKSDFTPNVGALSFTNPVHLRVNLSFMWPWLSEQAVQP